MLGEWAQLGVNGACNLLGATIVSVMYNAHMYKDITDIFVGIIEEQYMFLML